MKLIQSCNKIKAFGVEMDVLGSALEGSPLEAKTGEDGIFVRRTTALPTLDAAAAASKASRHKPDDAKKKESAHMGGILLKFLGIPAELSWMPIKDAVRKLIPETARVAFATNVTEAHTCVMLLSPFEGDLEVVSEMTVKVDDQEIKFEICYGEMLRECIKELPKHISKRRETLAKTRLKQKQKPVTLANQKFANLATVRSKVKEIIMSRKDGQVMIEGSPDTALVRAVLAFHPRASEKMVGIKGIKVDTSNHDAAANGKKSRCFHLIKEDDTSEDVSMMKCFAELERKLNAGEITAEGETKPAAEGKDAEVSVEAEKTADAEAEKKADAEAEKTADAEAEKTADAEATPEATPEAEKADAAASAA
jgi:hypothetical protein